MDQHAADGEESADNDCAEDAFTPIRSDTEKIGQVAIDFVDETVVVPRLPRPEPLPSGAADEGANENHGDPQDDEAEEKCSNGECSLFPGVVAGSERVGINIRNDHASAHDKRRHYYTCDPEIEVNQHFLQADEIPRRFGRVHREVGIAP